MAPRHIAAATALLLAPAFAAQHLSQHCPSSDICYQLNIPAQTARTGNGDIFFQISGSTDYSWIGLGQGSQMAGANIFVVYADGNGNVTVSPRLGTGNVMPQHDTAADVALLEGSGIRDGKMVANIRCSNCQSWSGGTTDFSSSSASWIYAAKSGSSLDTMDLNAQIAEHSAHGQFTWDLTSAQGGRDINPFVNSQGNAIPPKPSSGSSGSSSSGSSSSSDEASAPEEVIIVHGALASMAFLALFPFGSIMLRIPGLKGAIWIHAAIQSLAYVSFIIAAGLGIYAAKIQGELTDAHPVIGMLLLGLLFFQPWWGLFHHWGYQTRQSRTAVSYLHIWKGRILILLGMINGGLGLELVGLISIPGKKGYVIAYIIVACVMGSLFLANMVYSEVVRRRPSRDKSFTPTSTDSEKNSTNGA